MALMGWLAVLESNFVALGPALVLYLMVITQSSILVILTIAGSLIWTTGWILTCTIWWMFYSLFGAYEYIFLVWIGILISEFLRFFCVLHYRNFYFAFAKEKKIPSNRDAALAIGLGFGVMQVCVTYEGIFAELLGPGQLLGPCFLSVAHRDALLASGIVLLHISLTFLSMSLVFEYPPSSPSYSSSPSSEMRKEGGGEGEEDRTVGEVVKSKEREEEEQEVQEQTHGEEKEEQEDREEEPTQERRQISISQVMCGVWDDLSFLQSEKFKIAISCRILASLSTFLNLITDVSWLSEWICIVPIIVIFLVSGFLFWWERGFVCGSSDWEIL